MSTSTFRYRPSAIARISLREVAAFFVPQVPIVLMFPASQYLAGLNSRIFVQFFELFFPLVAAPALLYCVWRAHALHSTRIEFDGNELVWHDRQDRRGLVSNEVAGCLCTQRILHITSGRPEYSITIHSELDGFDELSQRLQCWFPASIHHLPAMPTQIVKPLLRNVAWYLPCTFLISQTPGVLGPLWRMLSHDELHYFVMLFPILLASAFALVIRRSILKHPPGITAANEPPAYYIVR